MPMEATVSVELTALLVWLVAPAVICGSLVALYPPYLRWRVGKWRGLSTAARTLASIASPRPRDTAVRSRRSQAPPGP